MGGYSTNTGRLAGWLSQLGGKDVVTGFWCVECTGVYTLYGIETMGTYILLTRYILSVHTQ